MTSSTPTAPEHAWYENTSTGTLHKVAVGSVEAKRLSREMREVYEDDSDEPALEPAFRKLPQAEAKKRLEKPEDIPGYPAEHVARAEKKARKEAAADLRDEALTQMLLNQASAEQAPAGDTGS